MMVPLLITFVDKKCVFCQQGFETGEDCSVVLRNPGHHRLMHFSELQGEETPLHLQILYNVTGMPYIPQGSQWGDGAFSYLAENFFLVFMIHPHCLPRGISIDEFWQVALTIKPWFTAANGLTFPPSSGVLQELIGAKSSNVPSEIFQLIWKNLAGSKVLRLGVSHVFNPETVAYLMSFPPIQAFDLDFSSPRLLPYAINFLGTSYKPFVSGSPTITDNSILRIVTDHFGIRTVEFFDEYSVQNHSPLPLGTWCILDTWGRARRCYRIMSRGLFICLQAFYHGSLLMFDIDSSASLYGPHTFSGTLTNYPSRIRTIKLEGLTALTVFMTKKGIQGIHGHYGDDSAYSTYENLQSVDKDDCSWRYFKLKELEEIASIWVCHCVSPHQHPTLALTTSLGRNFVFAPSWNEPPSHYRRISDSTTLYLHYEIPSLWGAITYFGATHMMRHDIENLPAPNMLNFARQEELVTLDNVDYIETYSDGDFPTTGCSVTYLDGSVAYLGQRKVGHPKTVVRRVNSPEWICTTTSVRGQPIGSQLPHSREMWSTDAMSVRVHFLEEGCMEHYREVYQDSDFFTDRCLYWYYSQDSDLVGTVLE